MVEFLAYRTEDVMTRDVVRVSPETALADVEMIFEEHDFNGLPVLDAEERLVGVVTKYDLLRAFSADDVDMFPPYAEIMKRPVGDVMTRDPTSVWPRTPLARVLEKLSRGRWKSLPVCDDGRLVGMVAREDVLRALRSAAAGEGPPRGAAREE
jgi:CBS domain-containing protein